MSASDVGHVQGYDLAASAGSAVFPAGNVAVAIPSAGVGTVATVTLDSSGVSPGTYTGSVTVGTAKGFRASTPVSATVKDDILWSIVALAVGALLGLGGHWLKTRGEPLAGELERYNLLIAGLSEISTDRRDFGAAFSDYLAGIRAGLGAQSVSAAKTRLDKVAASNDHVIAWVRRNRLLRERIARHVAPSGARLPNLEPAVSQENRVLTEEAASWWAGEAAQAPTSRDLPDAVALIDAMLGRLAGGSLTDGGVDGVLALYATGPLPEANTAARALLTANGLRDVGTQEPWTVLTSAVSTRLIPGALAVRWPIRHAGTLLGLVGAGLVVILGALTYFGDPTFGSPTQYVLLGVSALAATFAGVDIGALAKAGKLT